MTTRMLILLLGLLLAAGEAAAHVDHTPPETTVAAAARAGHASDAAQPVAEAAGTAAPGARARLGRFHPLVVHFPVALLLLLPVLEAARRLVGGGPGYDTAIGLLLAGAVAGAVGAVALGLAAGSGEEPGGLLIRHRGFGIETAVATILAWLLRGAWLRHGTSWLRRAYLVVLVLAAALVTVTGYLGAELTHGAGHLTG